MPKSKRAKVVALTKVKKRSKDKKDVLIDEIRESCDKFARIYLVSIENERNNFTQEIRKRLRPGKLVCAKNKVMQVALGTTPENRSPSEVETILADYRPRDYARSGSRASETVVLQKGVDTLSKLPHSVEAHLRQLGLPTILKEGRIHLLGDHTVCKAGEEMSADAAQILKLLEVQQAEFAMTVEAHWQRGGVFKDCSALED